jgi:acetyl esterase/lipase
MRTLRVFLAEVVILVLLGGLGSAVAAQSEEPNQQSAAPSLTTSLEYGDDPQQVIHVYEPAPRPAPRPAVVFFSGGGYDIGDPLWVLDSARQMAEAGYVAFAAGYRLHDPSTGTNLWPAQLEDAQAAVRWIRAHAADYGVDPDRICALGHSSGGHLASLVGMTDGRDTSDPDIGGISSRVTCVVSVSGDVDLTIGNPYPEQTAVYESLLGASYAEDPAAWRAVSPAYLVDTETVPILLIHGTRDTNVDVQASRNLAAALAEADREFVYAEMDADHFDIVEQPPTLPLINAFLAYQIHPEE